MKADAARVLLTGAGGGIGQAMALALVRAGAQVLLAGRQAAALQGQARQLDEAAGRAATAWQCGDLNVSADRQALVAAAEAFGANVVVHNAGVPSFGRFDSLPPEHLEQVLQTNLLVPMLLTQSLLPHLRRQPQAQLILVGSALGRLGLPGYAAYSASKFGLRGFAEALRRELADTAVRVQYLGPRSTRTGFNSSAATAYQAATGSAVDTPERVAQALLKLLHDGSAERFIGFPESLAVRLNGAAAPLLDGAFARHRASLEPDAPAAVAGAPR